MTDRYKEFLDELELSYTHSTFSAKFDTEVLWFPENKSLFIRGTDSFTDWIFNCFIWPDKYTGFHYGFYLKADAIIEKCVKIGIHPELVVGHSAGGGMAQYLGWFFNAEAYALACPKTYEPDLDSCGFGDWADQKLVIINQEKDIVAHMPPNLEHPIEPLWLNSEDFFFMAHMLIAFE